MSNGNVEQHPQPLSVRLEVVSADPRNPDPATTAEVGREVAGVLKKEGYTVQPAYTGTRGGTLYEIGMQVFHVIHDNKELLSALLPPVTAAVQYLVKRFGDKPTQNAPVPLVVINIPDAGEVTVDIAAASADEKLLERLILGDAALAASIKPESKVKITVRVPPRQVRRGRKA